MKILRFVWAPVLVAVGCLSFFQVRNAANAEDEQLWRHRNLGKAFYENPATQKEAIGEFRKALELAPKSVRERINYGLALLRAGITEEALAELKRAQQEDPSIPHTWFNLGVHYKKEGSFDESMAQFAKVAELDPNEPKAHYNLGVLAKLKGDPEEAIRRFELTAKLNPNLAAPHFQLYNAYRQAGQRDRAMEQLKIFQQLKKEQEGAAVPEDMEWCDYAEIYDPIPAREAPDEPAALRFETSSLGVKGAGMLALDANADGRPDLLVFSDGGAELFLGGSQRVENTGLPAGQKITGAAAGDWDNDGWADLCLLLDGKPALYRNENGRFTRQTVALPEGPFAGALWLDADHDYDVDLLLFGAQSRLIRNQGEGGFADRTADFPFVAGNATGGTFFRLIADSQSTDLLVWYADRPAVLYRDQLAGKYNAEPVEAIPAGTRAVIAADLDNDGWNDLIAVDAQGARVLFNERGRFQPGPRIAGASSIAVADLENRAFLDLVAGGAVHRNQGLQRFAQAATPEGLAGASRLLAADFDGDGRLDLASLAADGAARRHLNRTSLSNNAVSVVLKGVKNMKLAAAAEVEIKAGLVYQKRIYEGLPLHFGTRKEQKIEAVRITWPNALIQNETEQAGKGTLEYEEKQRLSGSCPMIFTWNGKEFEFITDVLGVAPLGASDGEGSYFPVDHDEYVQISAKSLVPKDGYYDIRVTEELREISYLDEIKLMVVDHPAGVEILTNDKWKSPPFPEFRLFGVERRIPPASARDHRGRDVLERVKRKDRTYADGFERTMAGTAETHWVELDFGAAAGSNQAILVLSGWVDWADGSTFLQAAQTGKGGLVPPYLQVQDSKGEWRTVIEDMGMPAGKPKTIVVDLSGRFLSASRKVRIVTNLALYWDEIFLSEETAAPETRLTTLAASKADLRFRGFSRNVVHPERRQPEHFVYADTHPFSMWNPIPGGFYTRYGDVRELLDTPDDRYAIIGAGDEIRLLFDARQAPPLPAGWQRSYLLKVDGWAKDGDLNTAYSQSVGPLPFHGMSQYPYPAGERFPDTEAHREWRERYNTRPALRLIRPLNEALKR